MTDRVNPFLGHEHRRPEVDLAEAARLLETAFGRSGIVRELGSHQDRNYLVAGADGARFVFKVARHGLSRAALHAENEAMRRVASAGLPFEVPVPQTARDGALVVAGTTSAGVTHDLRLVTFIEGEPLDEVGYLAPAVLRAHGALAAAVAGALDGFDHPALDRALQWDLRHASDVVAALASFVSTPARGTLLERSVAAADAALAPLVANLRIAVVHQDVTEANTVARRDEAGRPMPMGLIDFGDISRTWIAGDLAVVIAADAIHDVARPLQVAREVTRGYTSKLPLTAPEVAALWPLVVARAASVAISGDQQAALEPDNEYVGATRDDEWAALEAVVDVPFALAEATLREAAGLDPAERPLVKLATAPLFAGLGEIAALDLSTTSVDLDGAAIGDPGAAAGLVGRSSDADTRPVGRWGEARLVDATLDAMDEAATVHLGIDVFAPAGTSVHAPVGGRIRSHPGGLVIGGTVDVILDGVEPTVGEGTVVAAGDSIGVVAPTGPDGLPPHVHVQRVTAPGLDAPRRTVPSLAAAWLELCPDPSSLLGFPPDVAAAPLDDPAALLARRDGVLATTQLHYFDAPPRIERGWRHHLVDTTGRARIDIVNNVAVLGHSHPAVEAAVTRQLHLLNTNSRFLYEPMVAFAEALAARFPAPLDTVFLVNTGSEANELALRLARTATGNEDVLAVRGAYHGWTGATDAITTSVLDNPRALRTRPAWVHPVEAPNTFRGPHRGPDAGTRYADDVRATLGGLGSAGRGPAAFIAEALYGNAGGVVLPDGYLHEAYAAVRAAGGLAIADEVQVGYGRLGAYRWAFEQQRVVPDIVTVAKAAGNGMAVGAVITTRAIADAFGADGSFFSSVGGSPVACAAGLAVLRAIDEEGLQANARDVGAHLRAGLERATAGHPLVGAIHGMGLYLGVELIRERDTLEPADAEALAICERLLELGVICQPTGDGNNVLKVKPPLCLTRESADLVVEALGIALSGW
ncbi:MAG TPA: aminotransferase [Candidatus Limnocylindrales bacterium]|jgi:4-aminobutyrate aminotransferase-like enzyme/Ser/Thr protein kinase RdoA (MazF antagonist)